MYCFRTINDKINWALNRFNRALTSPSSSPEVNDIKVVVRSSWVKDEQITHDNYHDETKTMTHTFNKLPDDGDSWAPNNILKSGAKEKH